MTPPYCPPPTLHPSLPSPALPCPALPYPALPCPPLPSPPPPWLPDGFWKWVVNSSQIALVVSELKDLCTAVPFPLRQGLLRMPRLAQFLRSHTQASPRYRLPQEHGVWHLASLVFELTVPFLCKGKGLFPSKPGSFSLANLRTLHHDQRGQEDGRIKPQEGSKERTRGDLFPAHQKLSTEPPCHSCANIND